MPRIGFPRALPSAQAVLFTAFRAVGAMNEGTIEVQSLRTSERKTRVRGAHHGTFVQSGHLLYLRQFPSETLLARAHLVAAYLGLPLEVRQVGLGELEIRLAELVEEGKPERGTDETRCR